MEKINFGKKKSIKQKLLLALIILPVAAISFYTYLAVDMIQKDKSVQVLDTAIQNSKLYSTAFNSIFDKYKLLSQLLINDFESARSRNYFLKTYPDLVNLEIYQNNKSLLQKKFDLNEKPLLKDPPELPLYIKKILETNSEEDIFLFKNLGDNDRTLEFVTYSKKSKLLAFFSFKDLSFFSMTLTKSLFSTIIYVGKINSNVVIGNLRNRLSSEDLEVIKTNGKNSPYGLSGVYTEVKSKQQYVYAFSGEGNSNVRVVSIIPKELLDKSLIYLITKTIIFFILLLLAFISIGIFLTDKFTKTILDLTQATKLIAEGNYDIQVQCESDDELGVLSNSFNQMTHTIKDLLFQLNEYSHKLEKLVEIRTAELHEALSLKDSMLNSLGQGFMIFKNDGKFLNVFTKSTFDFFSINNESHIWDVLELPNENREGLQSLVSYMFNGTLSFEECAGLAPHAIELQSGKNLELQYFPVNDDGKMKGVIVVSTDRTDEIAAKRAWEIEVNKVKKILIIMNSPGIFAQYLNQQRSYINEIREIENDLGQLQANKSEVILGILHSLKGLSLQFRFIQLGHLAHELEDSIISNNTQNIRLSDRLEKTLQFELDQIKKDFNLSLDEKLLKIIRSVDQVKLLEFYSKIPNEELKKTFFNTILGLHFSDSINPFVTLTTDLLKDKNIEKMKFTIEGQELPLHPQHYNSLLLSLGHIFRNIVSHGIESDYEREVKNKTPERQIIASASLNNDKLLITISDDGKGIDPEKIRNRVISKSMEKFIHLSDEEILNAIFEQDFSTAEGVDLLSGRGVGLSIVKAEVEKLDGQIRVESLLGKGTKFKIVLPYLEA